MSFRFVNFRLQDKISNLGKRVQMIIDFALLEREKKKEKKI